MCVCLCLVVNVWKVCAALIYSDDDDDDDDDDDAHSLWMRRVR